MYVNSFQQIVRPNQFQVSENIARQSWVMIMIKQRLERFQPKTYTATNVLLSFNKATTDLQSSDVLGVLEGTDLKDEYVFITAHYDHLGKRRFCYLLWC